MKNVACWSAEDAYTIINPDADALPDHVFRAVHTDVPIQLRSGPNKPPTLVNSEDFLKRFLAPRDHVLVPVIGESGTGKSHLIRWMRLRLPPNDKREVIFVPKAETNLRDIVRALVERLPDDKRSEFAAALEGAGDTLRGQDAQRTALLNEIQTGLQNDQGDPRSGIDPDLEGYLLEGLRSVFLDPYLRQTHFLKDGGFAADLGAHVFERPAQYQPAEHRRVFTEADLPLDIGGIGKAASATGEFLDFLIAQPDATRLSAVSIVNRQLDWAIGRCLNISGDRLIELMLSIRRKLKSQGKSLVLLIEDFARLQGLDRALLQSLLEQRADLCVLRTAFASTTGFYETVAETVLTRLTFVVDMDVPLAAEKGGELERLVGRYMNALRLGEIALRDDLHGDTQKEEPFEVVNGCDGCSYQGECHSAFGAADGFGLYPFTKRALDIMAERADQNARQRFNLRTFQKNVLRPVVLEAPALAEGRFPPSQLLDNLGGVRDLPPAERRRVEEADPIDWKRRLVLLQLWDGAPVAQNLPTSIETAFGLSQVTVGSGRNSEKENKPSPKPAPRPDLSLGNQQPVELADWEKRLVELADWENSQRKLSAPTAQELRELIFKAICETIDWDSEGLAPSEFRGTRKPFQQASVVFWNQATNPTAQVVSITLPSNTQDARERYETVMALQGLLEERQSGGWNFKDGMQKLACLQECLSRWSAEVVRQLRESDSAGVGWDPAAAAFAVRVAAVLLTNEKLPTRSDFDVVRAGVGQIGEIIDFAHSGLSSLIAEIRSRDDELRAAIATRRTAMKGGSTKGELFIDTPSLLRAVAGLRKRGFVPEAPPEAALVRSQALRQLASLVRKVSTELSKLLREEVTLRRQWLSDVEMALGDGVAQKKIVGEIEDFVNEMGTLAIAGVNELASIRLTFEQVNYDRAIANARTLPEVGSERLTDIAVGVGGAINASRRLIKALKDVVGRAELEVSGRLRIAGIDPAIREETVSHLDSDLQRVTKCLEDEANAYTA